MLRRLACAIVAVAAGTALFAAPASAAPSGAGPAAAPADRQAGYYLALGDSLAFGFQPTRVTGQGYVDQLYAGLRARDPGLVLTNLGCPGEDTTTLRDGGICRYPGATSQLSAALDFLRAHRGRVRLVTLDIGANDLNPCVRTGTVNQSCVLSALRTVLVDVPAIVAALRSAAPHARLEGMTYYDPYLAAALTGPSGAALARQSLTITRILNGLLAAAYRLAGFRVADVFGAFASADTTPTSVPGLGTVPRNLARICQWTWMCAPAPLGPDIHANRQGYAVIARAFRALGNPVG